MTESAGYLVFRKRKPKTIEGAIPKREMRDIGKEVVEALKATYIEDPIEPDVSKPSASTEEDIVLYLGFPPNVQNNAD